MVVVVGLDPTNSQAEPEQRMFGTGIGTLRVTRRTDDRMTGTFDAEMFELGGGGFLTVAGGSFDVPLIRP
jgi:hypothetical protein